MTPWFTATRRFTPSEADWINYVQRSQLTQLEEVVSLDGILCPTILPEIHDEFWPHLVQENFLLNFFLDFDFLMSQVAGMANKNVLCVFRNPEQQPVAPAVADFKFLGYDLIEVRGSTSALTNCGGFPGAFANSELSSYGLLPSLERAVDVQKKLRVFHPGEPHADCDVWGIFRVWPLHLPATMGTCLTGYSPIL